VHSPDTSIIAGNPVFRNAGASANLHLLAKKKKARYDLDGKKVLFPIVSRGFSCAWFGTISFRHSRFSPDGRDRDGRERSAPSPME
jgi:hypothetical protein